MQRAAELQTGERDIGEGLTPGRGAGARKGSGNPARLPPTGDARGAFPHRSGPGPRFSRSRGRPGGLLRRNGWYGERRKRSRSGCSAGSTTTSCSPSSGSNRDASSWEPLRGMQVAFRKSAAVLGSTKRPFMLSRASTLNATITALEPGFCHVSFSADLRSVTPRISRRVGQDSWTRASSPRDPGDHDAVLGDRRGTDCRYFWEPVSACPSSVFARSRTGATGPGAGARPS